MEFYEGTVKLGFSRTGNRNSVIKKALSQNRSFCCLCIKRLNYLRLTSFKKITIVERLKEGPQGGWESEFCAARVLAFRALTWGIRWTKRFPGNVVTNNLVLSVVRVRHYFHLFLYKIACQLLCGVFFWDI